MRKLSAAIIFFLAAGAAQAGWTIVSAQTEVSSSGLQHRHVLLENSETGDRATVELAIFSMKLATLRVLDQPSEPRADLAELMQREHCLAGTNGGYFDPGYAPLGLLIVDGKTIVPLQRSRLLTGVLSAGTRGVQIARIGEYSRRQKLSAAVECGPFLVDLGVRVTGLEATRSARRTFAAVTKSDRAALGFCSEVSLAELSEILTVPLADEFTIWRALNLDGGSSSGFWFKRKEGSALSISEQKTVRDFIAVVPKS